MPKKGEKAPGIGGRKWFDGKDEIEILTKLESCWGIDSSDSEAAFYAGISIASLSRYLTAHPAIAERKAALKERPILLARRAILGAFDGHEIHTRKGKKVTVTHAPINADLALRYAERKRKAEFAPRTEVTAAEGAPLGAESLGKKIAMSEEASALAAALVAKLSEPLNDKSK